MPRRWLAPVLAGALIASFVAWTVAERAASARAAEVAARHRPRELNGDGYVSSRACRACHAQQYASWHASYHRTMTQPAGPASVRAAFDGTRLTYGGIDYQLTRRGDEFWVSVQGGYETSEHRLALVTGSHHLQIYWYETGEQRKLAPLAFAYLIDQARFIPRQAAFLRPPGPPRPHEEGRWNTSCIACHTTRGVPNERAPGEFDTHVAEFGIACEACHGPGRAHVAANSGPLARYARHLGLAQDDTIVNPKRLDHRRASEVCSQCHGIWQFRSDADHARWNEHGFAYRPGQDPTETQFLFQPSQREREPLVARVMQHVPAFAAGTFWADGMGRVSGREYNAMIESGCYQRGELSCLSCHAMHQHADDARPARAWADDQLAPGRDGDGACLGCHGELRDAARAQAHTRHAPGTSGSGCYDCHMPNTTYGLLKAMRSHQISIPDAGDTVRTGRPNACNLCHLDRTLGWTAGHLQRWYGIEPPEFDEAQRSVAASLVHALRGDAGQRALLAWGFAWPPARAASGDDWMIPALALLLDDPYDAIRQIAGRSLRTFPGFEQFAYDPVPRPGTRPAAAPRAIERWQELRRARGANGGARPELLLVGPTAIDEARGRALLADRDQRPVHLLE